VQVFAVFSSHYVDHRCIPKFLAENIKSEKTTEISIRDLIESNTVRDLLLGSAELVRALSFHVTITHLLNYLAYSISLLRLFCLDMALHSWVVQRW
jgi:hypothetical protein